MKSRIADAAKSLVKQNLNNYGDKKRGDFPVERPLIDEGNSRPCYRTKGARVEECRWSLLPDIAHGALDNF